MKHRFFPGIEFELVVINKLRAGTRAVSFLPGVGFVKGEIVSTDKNSYVFLLDKDGTVERCDWQQLTGALSN